MKRLGLRVSSFDRLIVGGGGSDSGSEVVERQKDLPREIDQKDQRLSGAAEKWIRY